MTFGRLERAQAARPFSEINVTPLVDVMLVLVVIFMVTAPLLASAIRLDLPTASTAAATEPVASISVSLDAEGRLFLDAQPVDAQQLAARLAEVAAANPDTELQLRADQGVAYGRVLELIAGAQQAGLSRIGFVAQTPPR